MFASTDAYMHSGHLDLRAAPDFCEGGLSSKCHIFMKAHYHDHMTVMMCTCTDLSCQLELHFYTLSFRCVNEDEDC